MRTLVLLQLCATVSAFADPNEWWNQSAMAIDPRPEGIQHHMEGTISFTKLGGNVDAKWYKGDLKLVLRNNLVTSTTTFVMNDTDTRINIVGKASELYRSVVEKYNAQQAVGYDLTSRLSVGAGIAWERDNTILLANRSTYFGGAHYGVLVKPPILFKVGAFLGFEDNSYAETGLEGFFDPGSFPSSYKSLGYRVMANTTLLPLYPKAVLLGDFDFLGYLKDSDYYHWTGGLTLQVQIVTGVSLTTRYQIRYEQGDLIESMANAFNSEAFRSAGFTQQIYNRDEVFFTGLTFSM